jgi:hypothetical protein
MTGSQTKFDTPTQAVTIRASRLARWSAACSNFSIAGPYAEWKLLGAISWRFPNEKLQWDGPNLRFTNNEKANDYVKPRFRAGWELKDIAV